MFLTHVVDLHTGQGSVGQSPRNCFARVVCMYMDLDNILICHQYDGIADGHQKLFEFMLSLRAHGLVQHNDELGAITKFDLFLFRLCLGCCLGALLLFYCVLNLFSLEYVESTLHDLHQALSAGIHHACFFQHRKHLRSLCKHFFCMFDHCRDELFEIICLLCQLRSLLSNTAGNCKNCSFLRLHNCFISCITRSCACCCKCDHVNLFLFAD